MSASQIKKGNQGAEGGGQERLPGENGMPLNPITDELEVCEQRIDWLIDSFHYVMGKLEQQGQPGEAHVVQHQCLPHAQALRELLSLLREEGGQRPGA